MSETVTRKRGRKASLSRPMILDAAVALIERNGVGALSMRKLAARLGVEAMSLYYHVSSKDELVDAVVDRLVQKIEPPAPSGDWKADIRTIAADFRAVAVRSPNVATILLSRQVFTTGVLTLTDAVLAALQQAGLDTERSVYAARAILSYVMGALLREVHPDAAAGVTREKMDRHAQAIAMAHLPNVAAAAPQLLRRTGEPEYRFGLELLLDAIEAQARR
ncbi:TetR family transcriptional regulator [Pseudohoeflea suaedae]|uniref:TetR family transcriptional regulator n=1 Tax=Pseudohoeflea suaedae TaxID=877384 RepID=A0A4R5PKN4_9HYPH|nr:TetR/AcrR family transcriptional regulator C-terminal domain-containing protein [Pseudohoeflea suaedae]TDH35868.1 TetR family transcriptional regulator [Pseudohoeflea suaedae]